MAGLEMGGELARLGKKPYTEEFIGFKKDFEDGIETILNSVTKFFQDSGDSTWDTTTRQPHQKLALLRRRAAPSS